MNDIIEFLLKNEADTPQVIFFMFFSCGIAIFHTVILGGLFNLKFKPWLFFVLNPLSLLIASVIDKRLVLPLLLLHFISVFLLGIIGAIYSGIRSVNKEKKEIAKIKRKYNAKETPLWKKIAGILLMILFFISFFFIGIHAFLLLFLIVPVLSSFFPSNKSRFLKYQKVLPTAAIRSVAMGLAEIEGTLEMIKPVVSPIKSKECIGFRYRIEKISSDKDGRDSFSTIFDEITCNPFYMVDETGKIEVNPDKMEFVYVPEDEQYRGSGKRYTQFILQPNDKMLLIGKASLKENNQPVFEYEDIKKVFAIAPVDKVKYYNTYKPLLNSFILFTCFFAFIASLILISPIRIENDTLIIDPPKFIANIDANTVIEQDHVNEDIKEANAIEAGQATENRVAPEDNAKPNQDNF
ncbi:hypothetical protein ACSTS3_13815 [Aquimarina muelleri]|uniref:hypothetical protein n=1 Tax=Aquimarina muelleri TaxID=279356 RepID=UPI003F686029